MLVREACEMVDMLSPNKIPFEMKLYWLRNLEKEIWETLIMTHEDATEERFSVKDGESRLIVDSPYDEVYTAFLRMKIDEVNNDITRYENSRLLYNRIMSEYRAYYNRTHMPKERARLKFF